MITNSKRESSIGLMFCILLVCVSVLMAFPYPAKSHCDTMDGPVIQDALSALESGDITSVLKWIKPEFETEIIEAFNLTLEFRSMSEEAREFADRYFLETLVRIHREGEGEPYTGIKPAGTEISPVVEAGDEAIEAGSIEAVIEMLTSELAEIIGTRFHEVMEAKAHMDESVEAGREYVEKYVGFIHFLEQLGNVLHSVHSSHGESGHH